VTEEFAGREDVAARPEDGHLSVLNSGVRALDWLVAR
jgi:hypothetical protein